MDVCRLSLYANVTKCPRIHDKYQTRLYNWLPEFFISQLMKIFTILFKTIFTLFLRSKMTCNILSSMLWTHCTISCCNRNSWLRRQSCQRCLWIRIESSQIHNIFLRYWKSSKFPFDDTASSTFQIINNFLRYWREEISLCWDCQTKQIC